MSEGAGLKLRARDAADLAIIAACLQDALIRPRDMTYLAEERRFAFVANRFRWEAAARGSEATATAPASAARLGDEDGDVEFADGETLGPVYQRVHCGVCFDRVRGVKLRGFTLAKGPEFLELLTVQAQGDAILIMFAGNATVRLEVEAVRCHFEDLGEAWPTAWRPEHVDADEAESRRKGPA
ncbi:DUF2948 family protein [Hypericibacter sp.]|uniref:DUF2948 family protein n=1 Tax=Hypericibacter sp. TaxID=2705401 RepID=UPI003D6D34FA